MANKMESIHETIIRDVVDVAMDLKDAKELGGIANRSKSFRSAASASSALTLVFPVLISNSISIDAAGMIAKAIERKAASMMQILFSAFQIDDAKDAIDYVSKFHSNMDTSRGITVDSLIDALDKYVISREESANPISADTIRKYEAVKEDMKYINFTLPDSISESSLNGYKYDSSCNLMNEASPYGDMAKAHKDYGDYYRNQLMTTDVKKANELVPTMMTINFVSMDGDEPVCVSDVVIGIKAKLYPLDSADIINRIISKNQDNNGFQKFIRATTREISFFKDFVFAVDKAKLDAISQSRRGSSNKLWKVLERRSTKSKLRRSFGMSNDASAISTLVVSQEEVEILRKEESINIENANVIRPIMESYNLMGVVLVDEAQEIASFIFDSGDDMYEQVSFTNLEREATDGSYKKIVNLMTKVAH